MPNYNVYASVDRSTIPPFKKLFAVMMENINKTHSFSASASKISEMEIFWNPFCTTSLSLILFYKQGY